MSGDLGPRAIVPAAFEVARQYPDLSLQLVGDRRQLQPLLSGAPPALAERVQAYHADGVIAMDADPRSALRGGRESSMWHALERLRSGQADACVSAGNTGALMAMGRHLLKTLPGIDRPAICKALPVETGCCYMLDLGANVTATAEQLRQFALLGSVLASARVANPRVALLNVGEEETKGTPLVRAAHALLKDDGRVNYIGFVEADKLFRGAAEVIVCDGFTGNIALKTSEGVARLIASKIVRDLYSRRRYRLLAYWLRPLGRRWQRELAPGLYNGASFLGLRKTLIKSHGGADSAAFAQAVEVARSQVEQRLCERISEQLPASGER